MEIAGGIKSTLHALGVYRHRLARQSFPGVAVLAYHGVRPRASTPMHFANLHVTAERLDEQCRALRRLGCTALSLADWVSIATGTALAPPRAVMITFDDGYRSVLTHALPVLERHAFPATVFVCTSPVERQVRFWFDALAEDGGEAAVAHAKTLAYGDWAGLVRRVERRADGGDPHAPLTIAELQRLASHPLMTIGAHTVSHPILAHAPVHVQRQEIEGSCAALGSWVGAMPGSFAFPNGRPGFDYAPATLRVLEGSGIAHAFTTAAGFADPCAARLEHPRFLMLDAVSGAELAHRLTMLWPRALAGAPA
jgi:peptidoglycan/xylan/chitin deacetylase (PgdA/CDA1 family)